MWHLNWKICSCNLERVLEKLIIFLISWTGKNMNNFSCTSLSPNFSWQKIIFYSWKDYFTMNLNPGINKRACEFKLKTHFTWDLFLLKTWVPIKPNLNLPTSYFINTKKTVSFSYGIEAFREFWISPKHTSQVFF
jgi:hypothetical protein